MAGLIFFNLSENQFVHVAAKLLRRALHHVNLESVSVYLDGERKGRRETKKNSHIYNLCALEHYVDHYFSYLI